MTSWLMNHVICHPITYDVPGGMHFTGKPVTERLNNKPLNNTYDRTDWRLNKSFHFPFPAYFTDEGFGLTYNVWWTKFGFRSDPFKSHHILNVAYFFNNEAYYGKYNGEWRHAIGDLDFGLDAFTRDPLSFNIITGLEMNRYRLRREEPLPHRKGGTDSTCSFVGFAFWFW